MELPWHGRPYIKLSISVHHLYVSIVHRQMNTNYNSIWIVIYIYVILMLFFPFVNKADFDLYYFGKSL